MSKLRDPIKDKRKSFSLLKSQVRYVPVCRLEDCDLALTDFEGPGSDSYCREHQLMLTEYGGMGKADRPHTFYRDWVCNDCGYDPRTDSAFDDIEDPFHKLACMRATLEGDHQHLKSDGGSDTKGNIVTRCCRCHRIKTMKNKDYLGAKKFNEASEAEQDT
jgi:cytochrome c553